MANRSISEKTAKIVWSRSGGLCAYPECGKPLIIDPPTGSDDPHALIGQMAHIVAHSPDGPRGDMAFRGDDRDGPENLVLLCPEHHIQVDQQRHSHPTDWLYRIKASHEQWVSDRLSPQQRFLQVRPSVSFVSDTLHSTLLPVIHIPLSVFSAPCTLTPQQIQERIMYPPIEEGTLFCPYILNNKNLVTFCDLGIATGPFSRCIDPRESQRASSWQWWENPDQARLYVMLLNRILNKITGRHGLQLDKEHQRYYFEPLAGPRSREISYFSLQGNKTSRLVAWQPTSRRTRSTRPYWEHLAISLQFHRMGENSWCLSLRPERRFTIDGFIALGGKQTGRRAARRISRIRNYDLLGELHFWRAFLSDGTPRIVCPFGTQSLIVDTELLSTNVSWPGIPNDSRPFKNRRFQEGLFSQVELEAALSSELGETDEWEAEEWASEDE